MTTPSLQEPIKQLQAEGVQLIGDFVSNCGLSQSARDFVDIIRFIGLTHEVLDLPLFPEREAEKKQQVLHPPLYPRPASRLSLLNFNADLLPSVAASFPRSYFEDRYLIGVWFWETEVFPPHQAAGFDFVDEVWVASAHIRNALEKISPVPVRQFSHLIHPPRPAGREALPASLNNNRFVFLFCFDFRSMAERKNPAGTCRAFIKAFPEALPDGPLCVIKSVAAYPDNITEFLDLQRQFRSRPDIIFMDGWLSPEQRDALMNRADCYVSLHRAEGLGLTLMESMSLAKPCIGTAYSGNMDFMTTENSWLIPYQMIPVGRRRWPFSSNHTWADPDLESAAAAMREACSDPGVIREKGRQAHDTITTRHSMEAVAGEIRLLLQEAISRPTRVKPGLFRLSTASDGKPVPTPTGRAQAYETLKTAKTLHQTARQQVRSLGRWKMDSGTRSALESILEVQKLQMEIQSQILRELGQMKQHTRGYEQNTFDRLLFDQQRSSLLLNELTATLWDAKNPASPPP